MVTRDEELKWAYLLDPCFELTNSAGKPLTDGYIEVYIAGTRNKYYCASDFSGTLHPFQIPLDSLGSNIVLANPDNAYDVYVYNRYGNLIMSRYNVTPADGGAVISNTERINELEETLVSAVTGLQGQIDDINDALENKKDKQEPYSVTLTPTQTVSAIIQNENGEMEVIYQEIDLPEEVPNVDIVSPASTISITTHIDEETNTKTFSIDLSDLGHLEYGQYMATEDVITGANMYRIKGNLDTTLDGKIKLHKGNSYHITVRGSYVCTDINNSVNTLDYIEYSTFTPFHVDVDNTVTDPQNFEISYDIFKLSNDTDYYIAFAASAGKVSNLTVEIHSLSNLSILDPDFKYQEGWGINIVSSVISVDPDIFNDYTTHTDVYESIVTAIDFVTGAMPATQVQSDWDETDESSPAYIQNKPDLDIYATHDEVEAAVSSIDLSEYTTHTEVYEATVTAVQIATGLIPDSEEVQFEEINLNDYALASAIPDVSDFTTHEDVHESIVTAIDYVTGIIPEAQVQSDWAQTDNEQPDYIKNKPTQMELIAGQNIGIFEDDHSITIAASGTDLTGYATHTEVYEATVTAVQVATGLIPELPEEEDVEFEEINLGDYALASAIPDVSDYTTHTEVYEATVTAVEIATAAIPDSEEVEFEDIDLSEYALASAIPDVSDFTTHSEVNNAIVTAVNYVTGIIPDAQVQSDWTENDNEDPAYIKNKPTQVELIAGQNIGIFTDEQSITIAASATDLTGYATESDVNSAIVTAINYVTGIIPDAQVQSNWEETDNTDPSYIQNKPDLSVYMTEEQVMEIVTGVTGLTEYGQFYATAVSGAAVMARAKGTIDVTNDGKIKLKKGSSYHVTVRGRYNQTTPSNVYSNISYIEYITNNNININVDKSITESQFFEISYDLYKLNSDSNYYVFFSGLEGTVNDLYIEIHALDGIGGNGGSVTGTAEYDAGWGIQILNNVISVNPSILNDYVTENELVTAIQTVVTAIPASQVQSNWTESDTSDPSYIQNKPQEYDVIAGENIGIIVNGNTVTISASGGDMSDYATKEELQDYVELVTGLIPELPDDINLVAGTNIGIMVSGNDLVIAASGSDLSDYATLEQLQDSVELVTGLIPDTSDLATKEELQDNIELVTGLIPTVQLNSSNMVTSINNYPIYSEGGGGSTYTAGDGIDITNNIISVDNTVALKTDIPDVSDLATKAELQDGLELVTGLIPDVTDYATHAEVNNVSGAIVNLIPELPEDLNLVAGQNIGIAISDNDIVISASGSQGTEYTAGDHIGIVNDEISVTGITELVAGNAITITTSGVSAIISSTGEAQVQSDWNVTDSSSKAYIKNKPTIPAAQVQSNWNETNTSSKAYIQNKPTIHNYTGASGVAINNDTITLDNPIGLVAGDNITIEVSGVSAIISAQGGGGTTYTAGTGIDITSDVISVDTTVIATVDMVSAVSGMIGDIETALANL